MGLEQHRHTAHATQREGRGPIGSGTAVTATDVIRIGGEQARTGRWRGDRHIAYLAPMPEYPAPSADFVRQCLDVLAHRGFERVVTGALSPLEQTGFLAAGFAVEQQLHLLGVDLDDIIDLRRTGCGPIPARLRRGRRKDWDAVLTVDGSAFPPFWRLDEGGLVEAMSATPRFRFRVAETDGRICGYTVCGRAGRRGFVQRLAVDPDHQGMGIGCALLVDGLRWMGRRGVTRAVVNTQIGNDAALALYERVGFRRETVGLSVLSAGLTL